MTMYENLPHDPVMLLSFVNTQLRDHYVSLDAFCDAFSVNADDIQKSLGTIDYKYDATQNQFI